jgi:hypothetical protein
VRGSARGTLTRRCGLLEAQDPLDLVQLSVGVLELGRASDEHVDADPIADRHLVDKTAEVPLKLGDASIQLVTAPLEIDWALLRRR